MSSSLRDPFDAGQIRAGMTPAGLARLGQLNLLQETDSTNTAILRLPAQQQHAHAVLADRQTGGRGRRQKAWHSPPGGNVYLSLGWRFRITDQPLSTLPLAVAIAVCRSLDHAGLNGHGIKWPNDILVGGKKLAGILVELQSAGTGSALAVVGVGLNVRMPQAGEGEAIEAIDRPWTDLASEMESGEGVLSRNHLVSLLLDELLSALEDFETRGFEGFSAEWRVLDVLQGKKILLDQQGLQISGTARGVDRDGGLLLETATAGVRVFHSGEVSVHYG